MDNNIRYQKVAGQFYEKNPEKLELFIKNSLDDCGQDILPANAFVNAVIAPHAGYVFSGKTAIKTISTATKNKYKNIFILAPSHYVGFKGIALSSFSKYETPLGYLDVNTKINEEISGKYFIRNNEPHINEHSLEVQLPIIKTFFPNTPIIPMICGHTDYSINENITASLIKYWNNDNLWIISSDFTHYGKNFNYVPFTDNIKENLKNLDLGAIEKILDINPKNLYNYLNDTGATICGRNPIMILLQMAENAPNKDLLKTKLIEYSTSGDLTGDYSHTVSYAGITVYS